MGIKFGVHRWCATIFLKALFISKLSNLLISLFLFYFYKVIDLSIVKLIDLIIRLMFMARSSMEINIAIYIISRFLAVLFICEKRFRCDSTLQILDLLRFPKIFKTREKKFYSIISPHIHESNAHRICLPKNKETFYL